jgi:hypothetical protein
MNSSPTTTLTLELDQSDDGGSTWNLIGFDEIPGGVIFVTKLNADKTTDLVTATLQPGTGRQVRATVTVAGHKVAVQGTLTTQ